MHWQIIKILISSLVITFASWLSNKKPGLAGFLVALPLSTLLVLAFSQSEYHDSQKSVEFAKNIFYAIPLSLLFFVPFLLADRLRLPFWGLYASGVILLFMGYLVHSTLVK